MDAPRVFCNPRGQSFPVYLQQDISPAWVDPIRALVTNFGGLVVDTPEPALAIVIFDKKTTLALNLIEKYAERVSQPVLKGVVNKDWINACIEANCLLGPPVKWGGFSISPTTLASFFDPQPDRLSVNPSPAVSAKPSVFQSWPSTPVQGFPQGFQQYIFPKSPNPTEGEPLQPIPASTRKGKYPRGSLPQTPAATNSTPDQLKLLNAGANVNKDDDEPKAPPEDQKVLRGSWKCSYTDLEVQYIKEYAAWTIRRGQGGISLPALALGIHQKMPWHTVGGLTTAFGRKDWLDGMPWKSPWPSKSMPEAALPRSIEKKSSQPSVPTPKANKIVSSSQLPEILQHWEANDPPPRPPPQDPALPADGGPYTDEELKFSIDYARWCLRRHVNLNSRELSLALETAIPRHTAAGWRARMCQKPAYWTKNAPDVARVLIPSRRGPRRAGNKRQAEESEDDTPLAESFTAREDEYFVAPMEPTSASSAAYLPEDVVEEMIEFLAKNQNVLISMNDADNLSPSARKRQWKPFAKTHISYGNASLFLKYHLEHADELEARALALMDGDGTRGRVKESRKAKRTGVPGKKMHAKVGAKSGAVDPDFEDSIAQAGPFTQGDLDDMVDFIVEHPDWFGLEENEPTPSQPKSQTFRIFAELHPKRSAASWREFHKQYSEDLEEKALKIMSGEGSGDEEDPSSTESKVGSDASDSEHGRQLGSEATMESPAKNNSRSTTFNSMGSPSLSLASAARPGIGARPLHQSDPVAGPSQIHPVTPLSSSSSLTPPSVGLAATKRPLDSSGHGEEGTPKRIKLILKPEPVSQ